MIDRASIYSNARAMEKALSELTQFIVDHPDDRSAVLLRAYVAVTDGDVDTARSAVQRLGALLGADPAVQALASKLVAAKG